MADELNNVVPGQQMTPEQKAALAKSNMEESATAHKMAADQRARDLAEGREAPLLPTIAESILDKLKELPPEKPAE